jgi:hypothetical protein
MPERTADDMRMFGIVVDDFKFVEQLFTEHGWDITKIVFKWNIELNRLEAYECSDCGVLRAIYNENDWWVVVE